jgi:hypothetical protein
VSREYHRLCQAAGLIEVSQRGFFLAKASSAGTHMQAQHAAAGISTQIIQHGIASREEVDETVRQLKAAAAWEFQVYFAAMHVELIAQIP